jgi:hypothetical protein
MLSRPGGSCEGQQAGTKASVPAAFVAGTDALVPEGSRPDFLLPKEQFLS